MSDYSCMRYIKSQINSKKDRLNELANDYLQNLDDIHRKEDLKIKIADLLLAEDSQKYECLSEDRQEALGRLNELVADLIFEKNILYKFAKRKKSDDKYEATFAYYLNRAAENYLIDKQRVDTYVYKDPDSGENERRSRLIPAERTDSDGETFNIIDEVICVPDEAVDKLIEKESELKILSIFIAFISHPNYNLSGRKNNENRVYYYKLKSTEKFMSVCSDMNGEKFLFDRIKEKENILLNSVDLDFSDYVKVKCCRSIEDFFTVKNKQNKYFEIKVNPEKGLGYPFKAQVYKKYYVKKDKGTISDGRITTLNKEYDSLLKLFFQK